MDKNPVEWIAQLLDLMGYPAQVTLTPKITGDGINHWLEIDVTGWRSDRVQNLIGHEGAVIDALQYLANATLNMGHGEDQHQFYTIEVGNYRAKRLAEIENIAREAAEWVRQRGQEYKIEHLNAAERRQVHMLLQDQSDLATESVGKEPHRHLIVKLANTQTQ
jgi:spoIIIJ-associated protein